MHHAALTLLVLILCHQTHAQSMPDFLPYRDGAFWGYSDSKGNIKIKPQWAFVDFFNGEKARVKFCDGHWGLIDKRGHYIIDPGKNWNGEWKGFVGTRMNITDGKGKQGMIDTNGQVLIPCLYSEIRKPFTYHPLWKVVFTEAVKDGKHGIIDTQNNVIIPFEYRSLLFETGSLLADRNTDDWGGTLRTLKPRVTTLKQLIIANNMDSLTGVLDGSGTMVVPFGAYKNIAFLGQHWLAAQHAGGYDVLDSNGKAILSNLTNLPQAAGAHYFIVHENDGDKRNTELYTDKGERVFPRGHRFGISTDGYYIILTVADTSNVSKPINYSGNVYRKRLSAQNLDMVSDWRQERYFKSLEPKFICGTGARTAAKLEMRMSIARENENRKPFVRIKDSLVKDFVRDNIHWRILGEVSRDLIAIQGNSRSCYAIVDHNGNFVVPARVTRDEPVYFDQKDGLTVVKRWANKDERIFSVNDLNGNVLLLADNVALSRAFRWKNKLYAITIIGGRYEQRLEERSLHDIRKFGFLINDSGQRVKALQHYVIVYMTDKLGVATDNFQGYFRVVDERGNSGIVSIDGEIMLPRLSFKDAATSKEGWPAFCPKFDSLQDYNATVTGLRSLQSTFKSPGDGFYLLDNKWVNKDGKEYMPGLVARNIRPARYGAVNTNEKNATAPTVPGIYVLDFLDTQPKMVFVTKDGLVLGRNLGEN